MKDNVKKNTSRVAVVTGSAGTLGGIIVKHLQNNGWIVAGIDLAKGEADLNLQVDVTDRIAMMGTAAEIEKSLDSPELLVTSAAVYEVAPFGELALDRWKTLLAVHLGGITNACAAFVPAMTAAGGGRIVTISHDFSGIEGSRTYNAAATGTIRAFTKSFACEVADQGVRVNCLSPRQPADDHAIAETITFLVDEGTFYTGQVVSICPVTPSSEGGVK